MYRTLAATGRVLGVSKQRVLDLIEHGPLVGRVDFDGVLKVEDEDLEAFRRPRSLFLPSESESDSQRVVDSAPGCAADLLAFPALLHLATARERGVASSFQARRGTTASKAYRAISDIPEVRRQGERFLRFVSPEPNTGCHIWTGCVDKRLGYGYFRLWPAKTIAAAHRFAWVLANNRAIPERHDVDHACHVRWCVNPHHLEAVTHAENIRRRDARRKDLGLPDNCAIARAITHQTRNSHLTLVRT